MSAVLLPTNPRHMWRRYAIGLAAILFCLSIPHVTALVSITSKAELAERINLSGKQRFHLQRLILLVDDYSRNKNSNERRLLREIIETFESRHLELSRSEPLSRTLQDLYNEPDDTISLNEMVENVLLEARAVLHSGKDEVLFGQFWLGASGSEFVMRKLDRVVSAYKVMAEETLAMVAMIHGAALVLAIVTMFGVGFLIFWPAHAATVRSLDEMESAKRKFRDLAEAGTDWIWETDGDGRFTYVSNGFERTLGLPRSAVIGRLRKEVCAHFDGDWAKHFSDLDERRAFRNFQYSATKPDGQIAFVSISGTPVYDKSGVFVGFRGAGRDRTPAELAKRHSKAQAEKVSLMNMVSAAANHSVDAKSTIRDCLALVCDEMGWAYGHIYEPASDGSARLEPTESWYVADDVRHNDFLETTSRTVFEKGQGLLGRAFSEKSNQWMYDSRIAADAVRSESADKAGLVGAVACPILVRDEVVAVLEFFSTEPLQSDPELEDLLNHICTQMGRVFEREETEEALTSHRDHLQELVDEATKSLQETAAELSFALNKEKELNAMQREFVSMASHEFRTPLAIIDSSAQRMARRSSKGQLTQANLMNHIDKIRRAVSRMARLMESTLTAARLEDGKIKIKIDRCNIADLVNEVVARQQDVSGSHHIRLRIDDVPNSIQADEGSIDQILTNFLSNAVKYAPGTPEIDVLLTQKEEHIAISVRDYGVGMDEDDLARIGERFFRAKTSTGIEGTGIGLNLVGRLIELHGGTFHADSKVGEGSTFTVRLPIAGPDCERSDAKDVA